MSALTLCIFYMHASWIATSESGEQFTVPELENGYWCEYDEKLCQPVYIEKIEGKIELSKRLHIRWPLVPFDME